MCFINDSELSQKVLRQIGEEKVDSLFFFFLSPKIFPLDIPLPVEMWRIFQCFSHLSLNVLTCLTLTSIYGIYVYIKVFIVTVVISEHSKT